MSKHDEKYLRKLEDAAFRGTVNTLRAYELAERADDEIKRLQGEVDEPWRKANRTRSTGKERLKAEARRLQADGQTIPQIMKAVGRSRRTVEGYLRDD